MSFNEWWLAEKDVLFPDVIPDEAEEWVRKGYNACATEVSGLMAQMEFDFSDDETHADVASSTWDAEHWLESQEIEEERINEVGK